MHGMAEAKVDVEVKVKVEVKIEIEIEVEVKVTEAWQAEERRKLADAKVKPKRSVAPKSVQPGAEPAADWSL